jgi:hypothetical protein
MVPPQAAPGIGVCNSSEEIQIVLRYPQLPGVTDMEGAREALDFYVFWEPFSTVRAARP